MSAAAPIACIICGAIAIWADEMAHRTGSWTWRLICWLNVVGAVAAVGVGIRGALA